MKKQKPKSAQSLDRYMQLKTLSKDDGWQWYDAKKSPMRLVGFAWFDQEKNIDVFHLDLHGNLRKVWMFLRIVQQADNFSFVRMPES